MREYNIIDVDGDDLMVIETSVDVSQYSDTQINVGAIKLKFENKVSLKQELPEDYSDSFVFDIGDQLEEAIIESLMELGVPHDTAFEISSCIGGTSVNVEVDICPEDGDVSISSIYEY